MIPSIFIELDELPLMPNNKLNKEALPIPNMKQKNDQHTHPNNKVEIILAKI